LLILSLNLKLAFQKAESERRWPTTRRRISRWIEAQFAAGRRWPTGAELRRR
jgi:hypothetical protein